MSARQIEPKLLERLGRIVVNWSFVENCVSDLFVFLTEGEPGTMIVVTASASQNAIIGWIRTLIDVRITPPEWANEVRGLMTEVDFLRSERNSLVHGLWSTAGPDNSVIIQTVRLDRRDMVKDAVFTASDLDDLIDDILNVQHRLLAVLESTKTFSRTIA